MADIKISQLTAKGTAIASTDLIEISESNGAGGYVTKSVTGANIIGSKQDTLVSGTNIKTLNSNSILGSGDLAVQPTLISGTNIKTIEGQSILGGGNINITNTDVGLGNVDNTSDLNKPISTATQTALNAKQNTITNSDSITQGVTNLFLTTGERTKLTNTSGVNTGDQINITGTAANVTGIVAVANGGTGTATPSLVAGTNVTITGSFPNQTINSTGGGGGGSTIFTHILSKPQSLFYYSNALTNSTLISGIKTANVLHLTNFTPAYDLTINTFLIEVTTIDAIGLGKVLIYSDLNGLPNTKLLESVSFSSATLGVKTITGFTFTFTAGVTYWIAVPTNSSTNRFKAMNFNNPMLSPLISASDTNFYNFWNIIAPYATMPTTITGLNSTNLGFFEHITHLVFRAV